MNVNEARNYETCKEKMVLKSWSGSRNMIGSWTSTWMDYYIREKKMDGVHFFMLFLIKKLVFENKLYIDWSSLTILEPTKT